MILPLLLLLSGTLFAEDPMLTIPKRSEPPVIDGKLSPGEWKNAAAVSLFGLYNKKGIFSAEQPVFYVAWDDIYLYIAMDSRESSANAVVAKTIRNDFSSIIGDDCVEIMLAAGTGKAVFDMDFATCYLAVNTLGAIWDAKFKPQRNECHNTWQSGAEFASETNGSQWTLEMRIPLKNISIEPIHPGTRWRINFCRTFYKYQWVALNPSGALNDARIGADLVFGGPDPAVRLLSCEGLNEGLLKAELELVNPTDREQTLTVSFTAECREQEGSKEVRNLVSKNTVKLRPGETRGVVAGNAQKLSWYNTVRLTVADAAGKILLDIPRTVVMPVLRLTRFIAPATPPVSVNAFFLPSKEELKIEFNAKNWLKKVSLSESDFNALIQVFGEDRTRPVLTSEFNGFRKGSGVWRCSTGKLPEGFYTVKIAVSNKGKAMLEVSDWFEKRIFPWMKQKILPAAVPLPYEPVRVKDRTLSIWGRCYRFGENGLPEEMTTQGRNYLTAPARFSLTVNGKEEPLRTIKPFQFLKRGDRKAEGESVLSSNGVRIIVRARTEYDGFVLYRVTCEPEKGPVEIDRLRLKIPLDARYIKFLSAAGDTAGVTVMGRVVSGKQGRIYDSMTDTRSVVMTPSFATLFWVADHDVSFCYAADIDKGWILRPDQPAVEAWRKGKCVDLFLNLIDLPSRLDTPHTMEFAFQTGPTKPRPEGWRGFQDVVNNPIGAPGSPYTRRQIGGDGFTTHGASHVLHPGTTPELRQHSKERIERLTVPGKVFVVGYHYWGQTVKGIPESRVFRGEWGITAEAWENSGTFDSHKWGLKTYGENRDMYRFMPVTIVPSYVDFLTNAYDETLQLTSLYGFYDDVGYPKPVYSEEFGLGYKKDGLEYYSSGLWLYRRRWKEAAEVNAKNNRLNLLSDSQRIHGHFMPAYAFIGVFAPCEQGFYNPFPEKDAFEFYGSLDNYAAMTPAKQFGQIPLIGLSSDRKEYVPFAQDTRSMCMLAFLNDHNLGCFGRRDQREIDRLSAARALFRQWEKDVSFTGYWESAKGVKVSNPAIQTSYYTRKGEALFLFGNTGNQTVTGIVAPDFKALGLDVSKLRLLNAETREPVPLKEYKFEVTVPKHDLVMVLAGPDGAFRIPERPDWDAFLGRENVAQWTPYMPEGVNGIGQVDGKHFVQGHDWGYAQMGAPLSGEPECSVRALLSGGGFMGLRWKNNAFLCGEARNGFMHYTLDGGRFVRGKNQLGSVSEYGWFPFVFNALKIVLGKDRITFYVSTDAKSWKEDYSVPRNAVFKEGPIELLLGWGHSGKEPLLRNLTKHFNPNPRYPSVKFFSHIAVGKE